MVLASLVIVQHALVLTGHEDSVQVGLAAVTRQATYGDLAVGGFFALSGFLLWGSSQRHSSMSFLRLRFFRLFPGFWAALLVVAFVFAPAIAWVGQRSGAFVLVGPDSAVTYVVRNLGLVIFQPTIGAVLEGNPHPQGLDGSFWTLAPEFLCYMGLLVLVRVAHGSFRWNSVVLASAAGGSTIVFGIAAPLLGPGRGDTLSLLASLAAAFFTGSLIGCRGWLKDARWGLVAAAGVSLALALALGLWLPFGPALLTVFVVSLGAAIRTGFAAKVGTRVDLSYGMYLYHFPVIQLLVAAGLTATTATLAVVGIAPLVWLITLPFAAMSWFVVESPAQMLGRRVTSRKQSPAVGPRTETPR